MSAEFGALCFRALAGGELVSQVRQSAKATQPAMEVPAKVVLRSDLRLPPQKNQMVPIKGCEVLSGLI